LWARKAEVFYDMGAYALSGPRTRKTHASSPVALQHSTALHHLRRLYESPPAGPYQRRRIACVGPTNRKWTRSPAASAWTRSKSVSRICSKKTTAS
jgi:hypothetical protein